MCCGLRFAEIGRQFLAGLAGKGVEIAPLRCRHGIVAADPIAGVLLQHGVLVIRGRGSKGARRFVPRLIGADANSLMPQTVVSTSDSVAQPGTRQL